MFDNLFASYVQIMCTFFYFPPHISCPAVVSFSQNDDCPGNSCKHDMILCAPQKVNVRELRGTQNLDTNSALQRRLFNLLTWLVSPLTARISSQKLYILLTRVCWHVHVRTTPRHHSKVQRLESTVSARGRFLINPVWRTFPHVRALHAHMDYCEAQHFRDSIDVHDAPQ